MSGRRHKILAYTALFAYAFVCLLFSCAASAQSTMFLVPENYQVEKGESFSLFMDSEDIIDNENVKFKHTPWPLEYLDWFYIRAGGTQINKDSVVPTDDTNMDYSVAIKQAGSAMIGLDNKERIEKISTGEFETFLKKKIASSNLPTGELPMPEGRDVLLRRLESSKTLVTVGMEQDRIAHSAVVLSKAGQTAEIRPIVDPASVKPGGELIFKVYIDEPSNHDLKVLVMHVNSGTISEFITDSARICHFKAVDSGVYYLEVHAAKPLKTFKQMNKKKIDKNEQNAQPDWELVSASISFEIKESKVESQ